MSIEREIGRIAATLVAVAALALVPLAAAARALGSEPGPPQNAVSATGASRSPPTGLGAVVDVAIDAHSGPLGEDPGGSVSFAVMINRITHPEPFPLSFSGPVTCLNVIGNVAFMNWEDWLGFPITLKLVDEGGNGRDGFNFASGNVATDCSSLPGGAFELTFDQILGAGRVVVHDAPPDTTLTHVPPASSARREVRFAFTASEPGSFQCRLDGDGYSPCVSPRRYRRLVPGRHVFRVRGVDAGGNVDPEPARWTFRITCRRGR